MRTVPFKPTAQEYAECLTCINYEDTPMRAIFNVSIAVTHKLMQKGQKLVSTDRDDFSKIPDTATKDTMTWLKRQPPTRKNAELSDKAYIKLREICTYYNITKLNQAMSFCLRTLRVYTDRKGIKLLTEWQPLTEAPVRHKNVAVTLSMSPELVVKYQARAIDLHTTVNKLMVQILEEGLDRD